MDSDLMYDFEQMAEELSEEDPEAFQELYDELMSTGQIHSQASTGVTLNLLLHSCILPSLHQGMVHTSFLLLLCLTINCFKMSFTSAGYFVHIASGAAGLLVLRLFFWPTCIYVILLTLFIYGLLTVLTAMVKSHHGPITAAICVGFLITCELYVGSTEEWHQSRGVHMILCMKMISLAFDVQWGRVSEVPGLAPYFGYCFCVANVMFGPWVSFKDYLMLLETDSLTWDWFVKFVTSLVKALSCLAFSNCVTSYVISDTAPHWLQAFRDAQSFRFSHYFVSFMSEVSMVACGLGASQVSTSNSGGGGGGGSGVKEWKWDLSVAKPSHIEFPRSLVDVVTNWNIPMHSWLKQYVFRPSKSAAGTLPAVLLTYGASALLHGLNFQLAAVLLSLGLFTYIEHGLRALLSRRWDACVASRPCPDGELCRHASNQEYTFWVAVVNVGWSVLAVAHLAYLGLMFDNSETASRGYDWRHTMSKWSDLGFFSHWTAAFTYLFYVLCRAIL